MTKYDKAAMVAEFFAEMKAIDDAPPDRPSSEEEVPPEYMSEEDQEEMMQDFERRKESLLQPCVDLAKQVTHSDKDLDTFLDEYVSILYRLADRPKP